MGHLDELYAKYKDRGLVVLAVTNEGKALVDKFVADTNSKHPIVIEGSDSAGAFGINGFPSSYLIDADGRIAWSGHPASVSEADIEGLLSGVIVLPTLPKKLAGAQKAFESRDYAGAKKVLDGLLAGTALADEDRKYAGEAVQWIEKRGADMLASAAKDDQGGDAHGAALRYRKVEGSFKGLDPAAKAKTALEEMAKDPAKKKEIDAGDAWEKTKEAGKKAKPEQAAAGFRAFAKKYAGTKAAEKAAAAAERLEKQAGK